jgi:hypothetical protein
MMMKKIIVLTLLSVLVISCNKKTEKPNEPKLRIKILVDSTQVRLNNLGQPSTIPSGNAAQHPLFNKIAAHYLEFTTNASATLGTGMIAYHAPETQMGGSTSIDFSKSIVKTPGELYLEIPLKNLNKGTYQYARLSVSYQNYDVQFYFNNMPFMGTLASFVGYRHYLTSFPVKNQNVTVNANVFQGYWAFESVNGVQTGQIPAGGITVPNPIFASSPIPAGSCVVTGQFASPFIITGNETKDIEMVLSLSVNNSFEWQDLNNNGKWDVGPSAFEPVVDMGLRGLIPSILP